MKKKSVIILSTALVVVTAAVTWLVTGGWSAFMPPISASLPQTGDYGPEEQAVLDASRQFWDAMENADEPGMRAVADPNCTFVHIGMTLSWMKRSGPIPAGCSSPLRSYFTASPWSGMTIPPSCSPTATTA